MRICMMNDNFYRSSGAAIAIRRIAESLKNADYCVAGCHSDGYLEDLSWVPAGRYEKFDLKCLNPARVVSELARFKTWFATQQCDLVNCHHRRISALLQLAQVPVLYTGQLVFDYATWFRVLHPRQMTAITPSVAKNLFETTGTPVLACISNPVHFPETPPKINLDDVRLRAVCVARLDPVKGHVNLLNAWKLLLDRGRNYELDLVGEGSLRAKLEAQVKQSSMENLVHFRGYTPNVASIVANALFAILPSRIEGQGVVTLEAAAAGRASLLTAVAGSIDLLPSDRKLPNGLAYGDVSGLADAIDQWFQSPEETLEEGEIFFRFLRSQCNPERIAREYEEVYLRVVSAAA